MDLKSLLPEEKLNLVLVSTKELEREPPYTNYGRIESSDVVKYTSFAPAEIEAIVAELNTLGLLIVEPDPAIGKTFLRTSDKAQSTFGHFDKMPLNDLSVLILQKSYELYRRNAFDINLQLNSALVGPMLGIASTGKLLSAVSNLIDKGLVRKLALMRGYTVFTMNERGVNLIENADKPNAPVSPSIVIQGSNQNVSINSQNANQAIIMSHTNELFQELEQLIRTKLSETDSKEPLADLETIKELSSAKAPKVALIQRILNNFDKLPVLIEVADKLREFISNLPH